MYTYVILSWPIPSYFVSIHCWTQAFPSDIRHGEYWTLSCHVSPWYVGKEINFSLSFFRLVTLPRPEMWVLLTKLFLAWSKKLWILVSYFMVKIAQLNNFIFFNKKHHMTYTNFTYRFICTHCVHITDLFSLTETHSHICTYYWLTLSLSLSLSCIHICVQSTYYRLSLSLSLSLIYTHKCTYYSLSHTDSYILLNFPYTHICILCTYYWISLTYSYINIYILFTVNIRNCYLWF